MNPRSNGWLCARVPAGDVADAIAGMRRVHAASTNTRMLTRHTHVGTLVERTLHDYLGGVEHTWPAEHDAKAPVDLVVLGYKVAVKSRTAHEEPWPGWSALVPEIQVPKMTTDGIDELFFGAATPAGLVTLLGGMSLTRFLARARHVRPGEPLDGRPCKLACFALPCGELDRPAAWLERLR